MQAKPRLPRRNQVTPEVGSFHPQYIYRHPQVNVPFFSEVGHFAQLSKSEPRLSARYTGTCARSDNAKRQTVRGCPKSSG